MKKIISVLLAVCFVVSAFCLPVAATYADQTSTAYIQVGTSAHDLQAYGLHTFTSYYVTSAPSINGKIETGEYNSGNLPSDVATIGSGLSLTNNLGTSDYTEEYGEDYEDFTVKTYLAYDDEFAYIAEEVTSAQEISYVTASGAESTINTSVRYGLNQSDAIPEAVSRLSNSYSYKMDASGLSVSSVSSADRNYKKLDGAVNSTVVTDVEAYNDGTITWDRSEYKKSENAAATYDASEGKHTYVFEYRIPLADIIYSSTGRFSKEDVAALLNGADFYGSYFFQIAVTRTGGADQNKQFFLSTGYAANTKLLPYSATSEDAEESTWAKAVKEYWTNANGEYLSITYVPSPVYHGGKSNPSPAAPSSSGFRPGLSGYGLNDVKSVYKIGSVATFTVHPDGLENTSPVAGDLRVIPTQFRVRNGFDTKITGSFSADYKSAQFQTSSLPVGLSTLVVTFTQQRFDGTGWVNTGVSKNVSRNITISGTVQGASQGSSQTGDSWTIAIIAGAAMILTAVVVSVVVVRKKRSF